AGTIKRSTSFRILLLFQRSSQERHSPCPVAPDTKETEMKKIIAITAFTLMCGSAFAQNTGAPAAAQNDMNKPGMNNMDKGSMNNGMSGTSGMSSDNKGKPNKEMSKDGSPAAGSKDNMMKK
ncbi:MAG: hypothetical protein ABW175_11510, partial [Bradyrhizobium sp.]